MSHIRRLLPSLNALVAFEAAVRCGTFANAARELGVTSPAVSRTIGRLELHLGMQLFKRTPTGAELTEHGGDLFAEVSKSFSNIERVLAGLRQNAQTKRRTVRISVSGAFATHWFMPRMNQFQALFPDVDIQWQLIIGPLDCPVNDADIAMRFDPKVDDRYRIFPLMPEFLLPVRSPVFDFNSTQSQSGLNQVITLSGSQFRWADLYSVDALKEIARELQFSDYNVVVQAALMGQGNAIGWLSVVSTLLANGSLVPSHPVVVSTGRRCDLVTSIKPDEWIIRDICDWIIDEYRRDVNEINKTYEGLIDEF
ncbi:MULTISPECIES: LysR family transcriptional regulator [Brucella/Ochrobactrum group]|uniref:LysR family transcriptional regulator n=1 Tax=Brucella sp. NBRC 113783 TaxID=3075478 RepID=UPI0029C01721|nr:LysR family transcriptional regulator [Brucella sp. NBRC 113783]MDX4072070.1 LysR family transcriptional regulator [Brucella sp. NBRC 113783]